MNNSLSGHSSSKNKKEYKDKLKVPILKQGIVSRNNLAYEIATNGTSS